MFPLKQRIIAGYKHGQWTFYGVRHKGNDYRAYYTTLYAPFDGRIISLPEDTGGGYWIQFKDNQGRIHHFAHMSSRMPIGAYDQGEPIGITGNSGKFTSGAHLHYHIRINGVVTDPETIYKGGTMNPVEKKQMWETMADNRDAVKALRGDVSKNLKLIGRREGNIEKQVTSIQKAIVRLEKAKGVSVTQFTEAEVGFIKGLFNLLKGLIGK